MPQHSKLDFVQFYMEVSVFGTNSLKKKLSPSKERMIYTQYIDNSGYFRLLVFLLLSIYLYISNQ